MPSFWHRNKYTVESHANLWNRPFDAGKTSDQAGQALTCSMEILWAETICRIFSALHVQSSTLYLSITPYKVHILSMTEHVPLQYDFHYWKYDF